MTRWRRVVAIVVIAAAIIGALILTERFEPTPPPSQHQHQTSPSGKSAQDDPFSRFWQWATNDAVAFFTMVLAAFTGALVAVSAIQIRFLIRADETARRSADAAKSSADAALTQARASEAHAAHMQASVKEAGRAATAMETAAAAAQTSSEISARTLAASNRAWLRITISVNSSQPMMFGVNGAQMSISPSIVNIGNAPALNMTFHAWMFVMTQADSAPEIFQIANCERIKANPMRGGEALFPNETYPASIGLIEIGHNVSVDPLQIIYGLDLSPNRDWIAPFIVGCVDYTFPADHLVHHQTRFCLQVMTNEGLVKPSRGIIQPQDIRLQSDMLGRGRYAD